MRIGTVYGKPFFAERTLTPFYASKPGLDPSSNHFRFLLITKDRQFWSPYLTKTQEGNLFKLESQPLVLESYLSLVGILVVDFQNHELTRPVDFKLPAQWAVGDTVKFTWRVRCLTS